MKNYSNSVMAELEGQLKRMPSNENHPIQSSQQAIKATIASLEQLKSFFKKHSFILEENFIISNFNAHVPEVIFK